ncbi:zinc-ribbon domain-containing protein [Candidatus Bathyarchaeota archaeon]|nr:zinc-ribbon domain-containing protein [Candidatus Bathyarchaeota archaeon]
MTSNCPKCGFENEADGSFCESCGTPLGKIPSPLPQTPPPSSNACPNCGHQNQTHYKHCSKCGYRLIAPAAQPVQPSIAQPEAPIKTTGGFRWFFCFTYPLYFLAQFLEFCLGSCCCWSCSSSKGCDPSGCDCSGCSDCSDCGDCNWGDCGSGGCDCGDCDCSGCDCGGCDCGGCDC